MSTKYGTILTAGEEITSTAVKERAMFALATRQPWKKMVHRHAFSFPTTATNALLRLGANLAYFRTNYAIIVLLVVFLGLLWHPFSLIVFLAMLAAWLFLYFLRDEPLRVLERVVDDVAVLVALSSATILALFMTGVAWNLVVSLLVGMVAVVAHAAVWGKDEHVLEEGRVYSAVPSAVVDPDVGASTSAV